MKKMTELKNQVFIFMLVLVAASLACHLPGSDWWVDVDDKGDVYVEVDDVQTILVTAETENEFPELPLESEGENDGRLAGTYVGEPPIPLALQEAQQNPNISNITIDANNVSINIEEDGTTYGEKILKYSYTAIGENDEPAHVSSSWKLTFEGGLLAPPYQLDATLDYHFVSPERDDKVTRDIIYDIQINGNIMIGTPTEGEFDSDENNLDMLIFEATRQ